MDTKLKDFIYHKNGWSKPGKVDKPKVGKLVFVMGNLRTIIFENKPFAFLNAMKKKLEKDPKYVGGKLEIKY